MKTKVKCSRCGSIKEVTEKRVGLDEKSGSWGDHNCFDGGMGSLYELVGKIQQKKRQDLSEKELDKLKKEASQPALDTKESLDQEIKELEKELSAKQVKRLLC